MSPLKNALCFLPLAMLACMISRTAAGAEPPGAASLLYESVSPAAKLDRSRIPEPIFEESPGLVGLYWTAWELAWKHVKEEPGLPQTPYMDEAFDPNAIWIWDTCFMSLFCKYAPGLFPGVQSLNNFYAPLHDPSATRPVLEIHHPDNPPLFAWVEYDNYHFTNDTAHLRTLLEEKKYLQAHFEWLETVKPGWTQKSLKRVSAPVAWSKEENGYFWAGNQSGMDNSPRERRNLLWIDAIAQQGLSALYISRLAHEIHDEELAALWQRKYEALKQKVNSLYWDEAAGMYSDIDATTLKPTGVRTPASFWPMMAEMCSPAQASRMAAQARDPAVFGGPRPWCTIARSDPSFSAPDGQYWRGAIWLPTAYMGIKALEKYGYYGLADETAANLLKEMLSTYENVEPHTIWECYSPTRDSPASDKDGKRRVRRDFCGWSALGPISLFIENVLGFHTVDAQSKRVEWRLHSKGAVGIKNLRFGGVVTDIVADGRGNVRASTNIPYTLVINAKSYEINPPQRVISVEQRELMKVICDPLH